MLASPLTLFYVDYCPQLLQGTEIKQYTLGFPIIKKKQKKTTQVWFMTVHTNFMNVLRCKQNNKKNMQTKIFY